MAMYDGKQPTKPGYPASFGKYNKALTRQEFKKMAQEFYEMNKLADPPPKGNGHPILSGCGRTLSEVKITGDNGSGTGSGYSCCSHCSNKVTLVLSTAQAREHHARTEKEENDVDTAAKEEASIKDVDSDEDQAESQDLLAGSEPDQSMTYQASQNEIVIPDPAPLLASRKRKAKEASDSSTDEQLATPANTRKRRNRKTTGDGTNTQRQLLFRSPGRNTSQTPTKRRQGPKGSKK